MNVFFVEDDDVDVCIICLVVDFVLKFELDVICVSLIGDVKFVICLGKFDVCLLDFWLGWEFLLCFLFVFEEMDMWFGIVVLFNILL